MRLSFIEEYPSADMFKKLDIIPFKINLYIASKNIDFFLQIKKKIEKKFPNVDQVIYWPILGLHEGYWFSAFTKREAVNRIIQELRKTKESFPVLWDAELPTLNKKLFVTEIFNIPANRKLIHNVLREQYLHHPCIVAEIPRWGIRRFLSERAGVSFPFTTYHRLDMLYTSFLTTKNKEAFLRRVIREQKNIYKKYTVALGLIAHGQEHRRLPVLTPQELERDLRIAHEEYVQEVLIYRLGGLSNPYLRVIKQFAS